MMDPKAEEKRIRVTLWIVGAAILAVAAVWGWWILPSGWPPGEGMTNRGAWGDSFAPLAILVNGAAIILALWSVTLQRLELRSALREMEKQSGEQERANDLQERANKLQEEANRASQTAVVARAQQTSAIVLAAVSLLDTEAEKVVGELQYHLREAEELKTRAQKSVEEMQRLGHHMTVLTQRRDVAQRLIQLKERLLAEAHDLAGVELSSVSGDRDPDDTRGYDSPREPSPASE